MLKVTTTRSEVPAVDEAATVSATLDDLARAGAQRMIAAALQLEVEECVTRFREERDVVEPLFNNLTKNLPTKSERRAPRGHTRGATPSARTKSTASEGTTPRERIKVAAATKPPRGVVSERVSRASDHRGARRTRQVTERTEQTAPIYSLGISTSGRAAYFDSN